MVAVTAASIAIPELVIRDLRRRYPSLWPALGSPRWTDSSVTFVSKTIKGLRRLSADAAIPNEQRVYCLRFWRLLVATYICYGAVVLIALADRYYFH